MEEIKKVLPMQEQQLEKPDFRELVLKNSFQTYPMNSFVMHADDAIDLLEKFWNDCLSMKQWIRFEDRKPEIGQEIFIVWPSGHYPPEYRLWNLTTSKQDWSDMRWLPVPNYKPEKI